MKVQTWTADIVPPFVPEFVGSHITPENDNATGKNFYIFRVDDKHELFKKYKNKAKQRRAAKMIMLKLGFVNPRYLDDDVIPDEFWNCPCCSEDN